jgi:hypothetical protein
MKKISLLIFCSLSAPLALLAQTDVSVSNFTTRGSGTVTFDVYWKSAGNDSVWVFVDYNTEGTMRRLPLMNAAASEGTVHKPNDQGAWLVAPAGESSFSATVQFSSTTTYKYGLCAYAIPQPPRGEYMAIDKMTFTGTPPFELTFEDGATTSVPAGEASAYNPAGKVLASFTDASKAPGVIKCKAPTTYTLIPSNICTDAAGVTLALSHTEVGATYQLYRTGASTGTPLATTGSATTFSNTYTAGNYSVQMIPHAAFCAATTAATTVTVVSYPTIGKQPGNSVICENTTAQLDVFATPPSQPTDGMRATRPPRKAAALIQPTIPQAP